MNVIWIEHEFIGIFFHHYGGLVYSICVLIYEAAAHFYSVSSHHIRADMKICIFGDLIWCLGGFLGQKDLSFSLGLRDMEMIPVGCKSRRQRGSPRWFADVVKEDLKIRVWEREMPHRGEMEAEIRSSRAELKLEEIVQLHTEFMKLIPLNVYWSSALWFDHASVTVPAPRLWCYWGKQLRAERCCWYEQTLPGEDEHHLLESTFNLIEASDVAACCSSAASATCTAAVSAGAEVHLL